MMCRAWHNSRTYYAFYDVDMESGKTVLGKVKRPEAPGMVRLSNENHISHMNLGDELNTTPRFFQFAHHPAL